MTSFTNLPQYIQDELRPIACFAGMNVEFVDLTRFLDLPELEWRTAFTKWDPGAGRGESFGNFCEEYVCTRPRRARGQGK